MPDRRTIWSRPVLGSVGLLTAYYAFPLQWHESVLDIAVGLVVTVIGLGLLGRVLVLELQHLRAGAPGRATGALVMMLVLLVVGFALGFFLLESLAPAQMEGLETRTDALYFTLSTMTTVGFGDVHAAGQLARALVCGLIVFNVLVVAGLVREYTVTGRTATGQTGPDRTGTEGPGGP